jgi:SulP family sulfate permease
MLCVGRWAALIPMATLAGILVVVLLTTFFLTVLVDLTLAMEIGMVLAVFLFMREMIQFNDVSPLKGQLEDMGDGAMERVVLPVDVEIFEITGPLFFGAVYKFKDAMKFIERPPKVFIIRMRHVPILSEVHSPQVMKELRDARLLFAIGKANVTDDLETSIKRSKELL